MYVCFFWSKFKLFFVCAMCNVIQQQQQQPSTADDNTAADDTTADESDTESVGIQAPCVCLFECVLSSFF